MAVAALARNLKLSDGDTEVLAGLRTAAVLRHDMPLQRAGEGIGRRDPEDDELDHRQGTLRVRIISAEGLPARPDGSACEPYVTVANVQLTGRRVRKTTSKVGVDASWHEVFDFERTSACAQARPTCIRFLAGQFSLSHFPCWSQATL